LFEKLLDQAAKGDIDEELALSILEGAREPGNALKLFGLASKVRDETLGPDLYWSGGGIRAAVPCKIVPRCKYCTYYARGDFKLDTIVKSAKIMEDFGLKQIHLVGGANLQGYDKEVMEIVQAIWAVSDLGIGLNFGCSLSEETIHKLKGMNVFGITIALETINEDIFSEAKPGDSLEKKKELMDICEREGIPIHAMLFVGLGGTLEDRVKLMFYVKQYSQLTNLSFSRFYPYPGTAYEGHERCSPWELATAVAVARLVLPKADLGIAAGNTADDIPLWYMAGGGNRLQGVYTADNQVVPGPGELVTRVDDEHVIISRMPVVKQYVEGMGRTISFED
jgi:biotin synthase